MPKIDPVTGCTVLTYSEFLQAEAAREGKEPADIQREIWESLAEDDRKQEAQYRDPANALRILVKIAQLQRWHWEELVQHNGEEVRCPCWNPTTKEYYEDVSVYDAGPCPPMPTTVLLVLEASHSERLRASNGSFTARVMCDDGQERRVWLLRGKPPGAARPRRGYCLDGRSRRGKGSVTQREAKRHAYRIGAQIIRTFIGEGNRAWPQEDEQQIIAALQELATQLERRCPLGAECEPAPLTDADIEPPHYLPQEFHVRG